MAKSNDLAVKENSVPKLSQDEFAGETGAGLEGTRPEERRPAFLYLLQTTSKAVNRGMSEYVEGAQAGMFYSTGSGRVFEEVDFFPIKREVMYVEWVPIEQAGGGFVGTHDPDSDFVRRYIKTDRDRFRKIVTEEGNQLIQTNTIYALAGPPGFTRIDDAELVAIPFTSIKLRHYTAFFDAAKRISYDGPNGPVRPNIYRHRWRLSSEFEQNWKPNGAWNVRIRLGGENKEAALLSIKDPLYPVVKELYEDAEKLKADYATERQPGEDDEPAPPF